MPSDPQLVSAMFERFSGKGYVTEIEINLDRCSLAGLAGGENA